MRCVIAVSLLSASLELVPDAMADFVKADSVLRPNNDATLRSPHVERVIIDEPQGFEPVIRIDFERSKPRPDQRRPNENPDQRSR